MGVGLLAVVAALTAWSLWAPSPGPSDPPPGAPAACGPWAPAEATPVALPVESTATWRRLRGTLVCFTHDLTITETYDLGRFGELLLADARLYGENTGLEVDDPSLHVIRLGARQRPSDGAVWPLPWGLEVGEVRVGDAVMRLAGRVWSSPAGGYVLEPHGAPAFDVRNPRPAAPAALPGDLRVAAFNLENYFVTLGERGADHPAALERQTAKLVAALAALDADVVAVMELERDPDDRPLRALAAALDAHLEAAAATAAAATEAAATEPAATEAAATDTAATAARARSYLAVPEASASAGRPGDAVRQGFLIDPTVVEVVALDADTAAVHERPPQALTLRHRASGERVTLVAVHLRSKARCPASGDVDLGFGCWNERRSAQARSLLAFGERMSQAHPGGLTLILGDLNAHRFEPPLAVFESATPPWQVLTDLVPPEAAVSYVFFGRSAALDHALASPALAPRVTGVDYWAINADEPPLAGAGSGSRPPPGYRPDPYRSSDHDPVVVALQLGPPGGERAAADERAAPTERAPADE